MSDVRVSFVLASYNGASFIDAQLRSILASLGPDDEIVVSDDGSTDDTLDVVRAIDDPRIRILSGEARLGYQGNFARAVAATRGRYIFFSDQDDICLAHRVPRSLEALSQFSCVCGDAEVVDEDLALLHRSHFALRRARFSTAWLIARPAVIGATLACRRDFVLAQLPFPAGVPHDLWLSVQAARRRSLAVLPEALILYRRHRRAVSSTTAASRRAVMVRVRERYRLVKAMMGFDRQSAQR
jgi:hypothetical protein